VSFKRPQFIQPIGILTLAGLNFFAFFLTHDLQKIGQYSLRREVLVDMSVWGVPIAELNEWWRLLTGAFLHADLRHILFNVLMLFLLGRRLERNVGTSYFALICFVSALGGSAGALLLTPMNPTVGASGIVYGLMAAVFVIEQKDGKDPWQEGLGTLIIVNVILSFLGPNVSVGGHLGGLLAGFVSGYCVGIRYRNRSRLITWASLVGSALLFGVIGWIAAKTWRSPLF
jgi:membrane associated rhomboid family serine protease